MIVSSEAAAEEAAASTTADRPPDPTPRRSSGLVREYGPPAALALLVGLLAVVMYATHRAGSDRVATT